MQQPEHMKGPRTEEYGWIKCGFCYWSKGICWEKKGECHLLEGIKDQFHPRRCYWYIDEDIREPNEKLISWVKEFVKLKKIRGRSRNKNGRWRKKRSDVGKPRGVRFDK